MKSNDTVDYDPVEHLWYQSRVRNDPGRIVDTRGPFFTERSLEQFKEDIEVPGGDRFVQKHGGYYVIREDEDVWMCPLGKFFDEYEILVSEGEQGEND